MINIHYCKWLMSEIQRLRKHYHLVDDIIPIVTGLYDSKFRLSGLSRKIQNNVARIRVVTCAGSESTLNLIIRVMTYDRDESRLLVRARAQKMLKKRRVDRGKNNKVYIVRDREWGRSGREEGTRWLSAIFIQRLECRQNHRPLHLSSFVPLSVPPVSSSFIRCLIPIHLSFSFVYL